MLTKQTFLCISRRLASRNCAICSTQVSAPLLLLSSPQNTSCVVNSLLICRMYLSVIGTSTPVRCFDIRQHALEKRRRRELEMAGLDPDNDDNDDDSNTLSALQSSLDNNDNGDSMCNNNDEDEAEEHRRMEEERRRQYMEKCQRENAEKRAKFKEFRARQIAMSQNRKAEQDARKREKERHRARQTRLLDESNEQGSKSTSQDDILQEDATDEAVADHDIESTENLSAGDNKTNDNNSNESTRIN